MAKCEYEPRTLDDKIVRDGLCAVSALSNDPFARDKFYVVGGMATQTYLPTRCRRGTCDIDLAVLVRLNKEDFRTFTKEARSCLLDNGYGVTDRKSQCAFVLEYSDGEGVCFIEFPRFSEKRFGEKYDALKREREHANSKIIEGTARTCFFANQADIVVPKLVRSINSLKRNPSFERYLGGAKMVLSNEAVTEYLEDIAKLRREAVDSGSPESAELVRFVSDLYDIRMLSEIAGLNPNYFRVSSSVWNTLVDKSWERDLIARTVLPSGFLEQ